MSISVSFGDRVSLQTITPLWQSFCDAFARDDDEIVIDASEFVDGDFSAIQLLVAARAQARRMERPIRLAHPANPALAALLGRAGFAPSSPEDVDFWFHGVLPA
ncbi:hypothetical protein Y88_1822 [Novosphingobium nitrogenifigens DSM 19370]|uniref:MlaB-like STAS domain-containing protein n=1 Tax=Novosphingobium nitrogenifigens DSM 19370 TaxID=983920 RepID=F1Z3T5_9SPHN|nr:STAS domain-containing protein [Novosphingobium nitrogenifigens]EGD60741.1 hypothetical protein Y88_1822 [Novosphingobium nitrogenifigens DSM 19370]